MVIGMRWIDEFSQHRVGTCSASHVAAGISTGHLRETAAVITSMALGAGCDPHFPDPFAME
jgi:hypothetical protein